MPENPQMTNKYIQIPAVHISSPPLLRRFCTMGITKSSTNGGFSWKAPERNSLSAGWFARPQCGYSGEIWVVKHQNNWNELVHFIRSIANIMIFGYIWVCPKMRGIPKWQFYCENWWTTTGFGVPDVLWKSLAHGLLKLAHDNTPLGRVPHHSSWLGHAKTHSENPKKLIWGVCHCFSKV